jgi:ABC-type multidrug transport system ATPase subunit
MEKVISTYNLSKNFGKTLAVGNLSIHVEKGEIYVFLGLNGAGKTTTIRMFLGMIRPANGTAEIFGERISTKTMKL